MKFPFPVLCIPLLALIIGCTAETPNNASVAKDPTSTSAPSPDDDAAVTTPPVEDSADSGSATTPDSSGDNASPSEAEEVVEGTFEPAAVSENALTIGSKAPSLDIEHWLSDGNGAFQAVTDFAPGKIYVVEFWATWCGPCVRSMPHLVELQESHKDTVQVISVSDEDLETVKGFLDRPYTEGGEDGPQTFGELTSAYCLTTDPDRSTGQEYMAAAGQNGIPACFLVGKTGLIEWIGHPMQLDEPLAKVIDDSWDRETFGAQFKKSQMFDLVMNQIFQAAQTGDMDKAQALLEKAKSAASDPQQKMQVQGIEAQLKMAPIAKKMQSGDMAGAIEDLEALAEESEGPIKQQVTRILQQLKAQAEAAAELTEESDVVEPTESSGDEE